jgi:hypothetical protein
VVVLEQAGEKGQVGHAVIISCAEPRRAGLHHPFGLQETPDARIALFGA